MKITPQAALKLEYLRVDLGNRGIFTAIPPVREKVRTDANIVRIGLNYYFSSAAPLTQPVVAKY